MQIHRPVLQALFLLGLWLGLEMQAHAQTDTVTYVYTDLQGTPLVHADAQGNVIARYDYTPYGNPVASLNGAPDGPGYTGHVYDPESGLVYMQQRYYQPDGRFLSPDPVGPSPGNLFSFNRYDYANDNPLRYTDPTGGIVHLINDGKSILKMINSRAAGRYTVDKRGNLQASKSKGDTSRYSNTYSDALNKAIGSRNVVSISIGANYKDPATGSTKSVDNDAGGGVTIGARSGGNQSVIISGNPNTSLKDTSGGTLRDSPADILSHELVGHAIPHIVGGGTGNAVKDENKVRSEVPGSGQRAAEPWHKE